MTTRNIGVTGAVARAYSAAKHTEQISKFYNKEDNMAGQATNEQQERQAAELQLRKTANLGFLFKATKEFMDASDQPMGVFKADSNLNTTLSSADSPVHTVGHDLRRLRRKMLADVEEGEVTEYIDAEFNNDIVEMLDGLMDVIVIAWGTAVTYVGEECAAEIAAEVARSNLDKIIIDEMGNETTLKRADGKVMKPEGWEAPDIKSILEKHNVIFPASTNDVLKMVRQEVEKPNGA